MADYRISNVFKQDGKVTMIYCGQWPNYTQFVRVEIDGERFFKLYRYGKRKLYQPENGYMVHKKTI